MKKNEFKSLNKILKKELQNQSVVALVNAAQGFMNIVDGVLEIPVNIEEQQFSEVNTFSFLNAERFLTNTNPIFCREYYRMKRNGEIHTSRNFSGIASCDLYTGELWLGRSDTVQDDLFMVHEFIHHLNLLPINQNKDVDQKNVLRTLFGESLSMFGELNYASSIKEDNLRKDAQKREVQIMSDAYDCAKKFKVEMFLIDLYKKHGELSEEIIKEAIAQCEDLELALLVNEKYEEIINGITGWGANLKFDFYLKYVLGAVVGYHIYDLGCEVEDIWYRMAIVCRRMYELSIDEFCSLFRIDFNNGMLIDKYRDKVNGISKIFNGEEKKV